MKPDWKDAPEWAQWLAQDKDGRWFWYQNKPALLDDCWDLVGANYEECDPQNTEWTNTLEKKPEEQQTMTKVDMNKQYRTIDGRPVRILCVDRKSDSGDSIVGLIKNETNETLHTWDQRGKSVSFPKWDLIEVQPYDDFKIDDKVLVRTSQYTDWEKRHFAGVSEDGLPLAFIYGGTSWTTDESTKWFECIKPDE